jgi:porphobilinogen synthase
MSFPNSRSRRLRKNKAIMNMVAESRVSTDNFIVPIFIMEGMDKKDPVRSMPGYYRFSRNLAVKEAGKLSRQRIKSVLLFIKVPDAKKTIPAGKPIIHEA